MAGLPNDENSIAARHVTHEVIDCRLRSLRVIKPDRPGLTREKYDIELGMIGRASRSQAVHVCQKEWKVALVQVTVHY